MERAPADLFDLEPHAPEGFAYTPGLLNEEESEQLLLQLKQVSFQPFEFRGYLGKRQVAYFGRRYDFTRGRLEPADPIPEFLQDVRRRAAEFASLAPERLEQVLINAYEVGAAIGWHRDRPQFEDVVGVSLGATARLRFRRRMGEGWERITVPVEPGSAYLLRGPARGDWEHSLVEATALRYSITFRTLRRRAARDNDDVASPELILARLG